MTDTDRIVFDECQIGGGFLTVRPLAQHGFVVVTPGALTLLGSDEQLIDTAPIGEVKARKLWITMRRVILMKLNGTRYSVQPAQGRYLPTTPPPGWGWRIQREGDRLMRLIQDAPAAPE